jgi:hypothetical protein
MLKELICATKFVGDAVAAVYILGVVPLDIAIFQFTF